METLFIVNKNSHWYAIKFVPNCGVHSFRMSFSMRFSIVFCFLTSFFKISLHCLFNSTPPFIDIYKFQNNKAAQDSPCQKNISFSGVPMLH